MITYGEFKQRLKYTLAGGRATAGLEPAVATYFKSAMNALLDVTEPLELITQDLFRFTKLRSLDDVYFIKQYKVPTKDEDIIELDESLIDSLVDLVAYYMSGKDKNGQIYLNNFLVKKDSAAVEKHLYLDDTEYFKTGRGGTFIPNKVRTDIPILLDDAGLLKYYMVFRDTGSTDGWVRLWDPGVVGNIDKFMVDPLNNNRLSKSSLNLWNQFCKYEDDTAGEAGVSTDEERMALKELDAIYLAKALGEEYESKLYKGTGCGCAGKS